MPKKGQTRDLPTDLRDVIADNLDQLMGVKNLTNTQLGAESGVGRNTVDRIRRKMVAANLDTIQAVAKALNVHPSLLLMKGGAAQLANVFATPVPDARLGAGWTRPDRRPLIEGSGNGKTHREIPHTKRKIKSRA